ncbi:transcriptional regulator [Amycolatopsis antarctica]|uniref:Transcriptional regulator n=1 Tax=Amycolatopsis antarctica TaxID=1854586 RepID=A0A263D9H2_9PSEU|nr:metalloregulator ArsR/SmtB family transcription factor [Amycolatopsis antarctica]OZM75021.1 transcriptional regulator [Amycolatopsis antarctica]
MRQTEDQLNHTFAALADPTRRAILTLLAGNEATVHEMAERFAVSPQAISKHLKVLERAELLTREKQGQRRPCRLRTRPLISSAMWMEHHRQTVEARLDRLGDLLDEMQREDRNTKNHETKGKTDEH